jgi:hypothetical protein
VADFSGLAKFRAPGGLDIYHEAANKGDDIF